MSIKFILIGLAVAALGGILWHDHWISKKYQATKAELVQANATITAEREVRKIEQDDRRRADESAKSLEAELARIGSAPKPVSVFCRPARVSPAGEGGTAPELASAAAGDGTEGPLRDIGAAVDAVRVEQQTNAARQRALIEWEIARTH
jgi:hypothetical protein